MRRSIHPSKRQWEREKGSSEKPVNHRENHLEQLWPPREGVSKWKFSKIAKKYIFQKIENKLYFFIYFACTLRMSVFVFFLLLEDALIFLLFLAPLINFDGCLARSPLEQNRTLTLPDGRLPTDVRKKGGISRAFQAGNDHRKKRSNAHFVSDKNILADNTET